MKRRLAFFLSLVFCLLCAFPFGGCQEPPTPFDPNKVGEPTNEIDLSFGRVEEDMFTSRDKDDHYDEGSAVHITLCDDEILCSASDVRIDGSSVTILGGGTYIFSGTLTNGEIIVWARDTEKPHLILDGVDITSAGASILVLNADKTVITLAEGSKNILINNGAFAPVEGANVDGAIFSTADLTLNGKGELFVYSGAGHGIVSNDDLVITGGDYEINAAGHALKGNDSLRVCGNPSFTLTAGKDGLHAENKDDPTLGFVYIAGGTYDIDATGDGVSASAHMQITGGSFDILSGGGFENGKEHESTQMGGGPGGPGGPGGMPMPRATSTDENDTTISAKGIKAGKSLLIEGGSFTLDTADDALHADADLVVRGGSFAVKTGDDALHADVTLAIFGGTLTVTESYEGLEAQHVEMLGGNVTLTCTDDGINAAGGNDESGTGGGFGGDFGTGGATGSVHMGGGLLYMNASGDGIDANGSFLMTGGQLTICGPTQGDTSVLDFDGSAEICGGIFIGTGSYMMAQSFSESSSQGVIALSVGQQPAGTAVTLSGGAAQLSYEPTLPFQILILSTPDMVKGQIYTVSVGELSADFQAY